MSQFTDLLTDSVHGDAQVREFGDVAPPIHVATMFEYSKNPDELFPAGSPQAPKLAYSRELHVNSMRVDAVLSRLLDGYAVSFSSGQSAFHALLVLKCPKRLFIGDGYHGIHEVAELFQRVSGLEIHPFDKIESLAQPGDIVHLETPVNPISLAFDISQFAARAHEKGAILSVDATLAPPPLMEPFKFGTDIIVHSATKYFGGHSDALAGVLVTKNPEEAKQMVKDRAVMGTILPSFEAWALLRSLKTFPLRIKQQNSNANAIVKFLSTNIDTLPKLVKVHSSNLQSEAYVSEQLPLGGSPTFSIELTDEKTAKEFPSKLKLFYHATSLGSVHSLVEWRRMSETQVSPVLIRFSIGIESPEDLIEDLRQALSS